MTNRVDLPLPALSHVDDRTPVPTVRELWFIFARSTAIFCVFVGLAACGWFLVDGPMAVYTLNHSHPELFAELLAVAEPFGNGISVMLIAVLIWRLDPGNLRRMPRLLVMAIGAGMAADGLKLLVGRWRPITGQFDPADMATTLVGWLPLFGLPSAEQSFPSAHTATAVGLAVALAWIYPRARWLFLGGALLVGLQRVAYGSHFVSDVCAGAAVGWFVAAGTLHSPHLGRLFRRIETPPTIACHPHALGGIQLHTELVPVPQPLRTGQGPKSERHASVPQRRRRAA